MNVEIKVVDPIVNFDAASQMLLDNWAESGTPMPFKLEDTRRFYQHLAAVGMLFAVAAYEGTVLIGYCIVTIVPYPMNHSYFVCNADGLYIRPEYRSGLVLGRMMEAVRFLAKDNKARAIQWHAADGSPFVDMLAARFPRLSHYFREALDE